MKYLFFDIECANCFDGVGKICEFGYVLTDENFKVLEDDNILVNPKTQFDWYVLKKMLAYKKQDYLASPTYTESFPKISSLFGNDTVVFGYSTDDDISYVNAESRRFHLPFIKCTFLDVAGIYTSYTNTTGKLSKVAEELGVYKDEHAHRALDDAIMTMDVLKKLCENNKLTLPQMVEKFYSYRGECKEGSYTYPEEKFSSAKKEHGNNMKPGSNNAKKFDEFTRKVKPKKVVLDNPLKGKHIAFSANYERKHFREMMALIQEMSNSGARYQSIMEKVDIYVKYDVVKEDGTLKNCPRLAFINNNQDKCKAQIVTFDEFLKMLNLDEESLTKLAEKYKEI